MMAEGGQAKIFGRRRNPVMVVLAHGDTVRHVTLTHGLALKCAAGLAVMAGLGAAILTFAIPNETGAPALPSDHMVRQSYENRIAALRSQLDEATSRQIVAQKMVESKVDILLNQQKMIAERYLRLEPLIERARETGVLGDAEPASIPLPQPKPETAEMDPFDGLAAAIGEEPEAAPSVNPAATPAKDAKNATKLLDPFATASIRNSDLALSAETLHQVGKAIDHAELQMIADLRILTNEAIDKTIEIASLLADVGLEVEPGGDLALGGPFEPVPEDFDEQLEDLEDALKRLEDVRALSASLPFDAPMSSRLISSTFGVRSDPFLRRRALHSGIDYAASRGTPIHATAPGKVVSAGSSGGYGMMVEIDHGNGIHTRYGHMSRITVSVGQTIEKGEQIGAVGSTGRSTGPHLHYEVRRDDQAIDPMRFIRTGRRLKDLV
ncbi:M23 family metallopeptidase [Fulvimarina manganoxydans]|nr:M23 family metallopeptidase [Fulvimarina manganoxydans]